MKNIIGKISFFTIFIMLFSCVNQNVQNPKTVEEWLNSGEFVFTPTSANPTGSDVANIMNSIPGGSPSQVLNIDRGYFLKINKDILNAELPYFGRMYTPSMDPMKNSVKFKDAQYDVSKTKGKNGSTVYQISPKNQNVRRFNLEVFPNGKAYLSVTFNDRQPISYSGHIVKALE